MKSDSEIQIDNVLAQMCMLRDRTIPETLRQYPNAFERSKAQEVLEDINTVNDYILDISDLPRNAAYFDRAKDSVFALLALLEEKPKKADDVSEEPEQYSNVMQAVKEHCFIVGPGLNTLLEKVDRDSKKEVIDIARRGAVAALLGAAFGFPRMRNSTTTFDLNNEIFLNFQTELHGGNLMTTLDDGRYEGQFKAYFDLAYATADIIVPFSKSENNYHTRNKLIDLLKELGSGSYRYTYGINKSKNIHFDNNWLSKPVGKTLFDCLTIHKNKPETAKVIELILDYLPFTRTMRFKLGETGSVTLEQLARMELKKWPLPLPDEKDRVPGANYADDRGYFINTGFLPENVKSQLVASPPNIVLADKITAAIKKFDERDRKNLAHHTR